MRFVVSVEDQGEVWQVGVGGEQELYSHEMVQRAVGGHRLPVLAGMSDEDVETLAARLARISDERKARDEEPEAVGRHLFEALLGEEAWNAITAAAGQAPIVELALRWPADQADLHRLPWELLHDGERFLSDSHAPLVAITRLVPVETELPKQLEILPRVLFAIGSDLTDPVIRPGAEIMGILRSRREGKEFASFVLEAASPQRIEREVALRKPDVVHLICHGAPDHLRLHKDGAAGQGEFGPEVLGRILAQPDQAPPLVVLSACEAGKPEGPNSAPLAASLVESGLPLVIAMGGRITDLGCRLFARRFTDSLVAGEPIVQAVAEGRSAALLARRSSAASQLEWALPIIFQSESVPSEFAALVPGAAATIGQRVSNFSLMQDPPVFCGRVDLLSAFDKLLDPAGHKNVLMISAPHPVKGLGENRLLDEMTGRALKLGHVAVRLPSCEAPKTPVALAASLVIASLRTRDWLGLPSLTESHVLDYLQEQAEKAGAAAIESQDDVREALAQFHKDSETTIDPNVLMLRLNRDLRRLHADAAEHGEYLDPAPVVVVLLGEVEKYDQAADALFDYLESDGRLGSADAPVQLVVAYGEVLGATEKLHGVENRLAGKASIMKMDLHPFTDEEQPLAMQWVLANPRSEPEFADWAYVATDPEGPWTTTLGSQVGGLPGKLNDERFYIMAYMTSSRLAGAPTQWFEAADDEEVLRQYLDSGQ